MTITDRLHSSISAVCPIDGVCIGQRGNSATVRILFATSATNPQKIAAQAVVDSFDWSDVVQATWEADQFPERRDLRAAVNQAIIDNDTFLAIANSNNAQVLAQVKRLTQQNNRIIRRLAQID